MNLALTLWMVACGSSGSFCESGSAQTQIWNVCGYEGDTCSFRGTREVRYGTPDHFVTSTATNGLRCSSAVFGDPAVGHHKTCWVLTPEAEQPADPVPAPAPSPPPAPPTGSAAGPRVSSFTASGPITARSGQVIAGVRVSNPNGPCISVVGVSNVVVRDSDIGPCGGEAVRVDGGANNVTVEHNAIRNSAHGVRATNSSAVNTLFNTIQDIPAAPGQYRHAIEYSWMNGGTVQGNVMTGTFPNDVMSGYESNNLRFLDNRFDVTVLEPTGAAFTMGDSTSGRPGSNNYVAGNVVYQRGGVPAGVFGSNGNTVLEKNCLTAGIQAYNYSGVFVGVTVRNNVINIGASFVPDPTVITGWSSNIDSTNCSLLPR